MRMKMGSRIRPIFFAAQRRSQAWQMSIKCVQTAALLCCHGTPLALKFFNLTKLVGCMASAWIGDCYRTGNDMKWYQPVSQFHSPTERTMSQC